MPFNLTKNIKSVWVTRNIQFCSQRVCVCQGLHSGAGNSDVESDLDKEDSPPHQKIAFFS